MDNLNPRWGKFIRHLITYLAVILLLTGVNFVFTPETIWVLWVALGWGIAVTFDFVNALSGEEEQRPKEGKGQKSKKVEEMPTEQELNAPPSFSAAEHLNAPPPLTSKANAPSPSPKTATTAKPLEKLSPTPQPAVKSQGNGGEFASPLIQAHLDRARAYKEHIDEMAKPSQNKNMKNLAAQVEQWVKAIETLARRIDRFQKNHLIHQDLETVPQSIAGLEERLAGEKNETLRLELERTLANRRNQLASLERLQVMMSRAEIKIESTLSSLGAIYSQLLTNQSTDHVADYSRLSAEVDEERRTLEDHLEALEEVKFGQM
jgi:hypothetical protein